MRIAFVSVSDRMGGSEVVLLELLRGLRRRRPSWDLHLLAPGDGPLSQGARASGAAVSVVEMPAALASFGEAGAAAGAARLPLQIVRLAAHLPAYEREVSATLSRIAPDVVHTNGLKAHVVAARGRLAGTSLVWHMHEYISRRPLTRLVLRHYARGCAAVVANSESVAADVRAVIGGAAPVSTIHNAVDLDRFSPDGPRADLDRMAGLPPAGAGVVRVGLVATFARWKGHPLFLRALSAIPGDVPLRGYVVGGPMYDTTGSQYSVDELKSLARDLGVNGRVGFTGFTDAPADALRALDVVVHASTEPEPFGMVIAEAMACGRAVVTSGTGGAAELARDGVEVVTHRMGDASDLARRLTTLVGDAGLRERLGRAAHATALQRFDPCRLIDEFVTVYESRMPAWRRG
jgi:glycosyltransferase involved in cell wall biosynthesis